MTRAIADPTFKKLNAELDRAEASALDALNALNNSSGKAPPGLLVVLKPRYQFGSMAYPLYDPNDIEVSVMVDLREGLRVAASAVAKLEGVRPAYAISMIEIASADLPFWLKKGFFPKAAIPPSFAGRDLVLFSASNASGQVIRRLSQFVNSSVLLATDSRRLGSSVQAQLDQSVCEMDVFWSHLKRVKKQQLEYPERRNYL